MIRNNSQLPYLVTVDYHNQSDYDNIINWLYNNFGFVKNDSYNYNISYISDIDELIEVCFANENDAIAFSLAWKEFNNKCYYIDPPSGWKFGFPKIIPISQLNRVLDWLIENGYPENEIIQFTKYGRNLPYRIWSK